MEGKVKGKVIPVLNKVPRREEHVSCSSNRHDMKTYGGVDV